MAPDNLSYGAFAGVYDDFMDNIPYDRWAERIRQRLLKAGITDGIVADLGCGTGRMTRLLSSAGYDMIGIDASPEMLSEARAKGGDEGILWLCQDMREFELYGTVRAIVCVCDCFNYLCSSDELLGVLRLAENYLDYDGIVIFDMLTPHYYREILGGGTFAENRDDASFIWENSYDDDERVNSSVLTLYIREDEYYRRYEEEHVQYAYEPDEIAGLMREAGLHNIETLDDETDGPVTESTQRAVFIGYKRSKPQEAGRLAEK